jgi:hypothetical protein
MTSYSVVTTTKNLEYHIDQHYEYYEYDVPKYQELPATEDFIFQKIEHCLELEDSPELENFLLDEYALEDASKEFTFLGSSTFISFFQANLVDIPDSLDKSISLQRPQNELPILKLNNYFMRHGKRYQSMKLLNRTLLLDYEERIKSVLRPDPRLFN